MMSYAIISEKLCKELDKNFRRLVIPVLISCGFMVPSVSVAGQASLGPIIVQQTQQVVNESSEAGEQKRQEFLRYLESQLAEFDVRFEALKSQSEDLREKARVELLERLNRLQARKQELLPKIDQATRTSEAAWEDIKAGLDRAASDLKTSLEQAASHFF